MSEVKQCDRCKRLENLGIIKGEDIRRVKFQGEAKKKWFSVQNWKEVDLCYDCLREFWDFVKSTPST